MLVHGYSVQNISNSMVPFVIPPNGYIRHATSLYVVSVKYMAIQDMKSLSTCGQYAKVFVRDQAEKFSDLGLGVADVWPNHKALPTLTMD